MFCKRCKEEIPEEAVYCPYCGKKQVHTESTSKSRRRANGLGTVYKLSGKRRKPWVAAKNKIIIGYFETKTAALEALNAIGTQELSDWYNNSGGDF